MLKHILISIVLSVLSISCFAQYNVDFGAGQGFEKILEVESCNGRDALFVSWQQNAYGSGNGRIVFGLYNQLSGTVSIPSGYPSDASIRLNSRDIDIEATALNRGATGSCTGFAIALTIRPGSSNQSLHMLILDSSAELVSFNTVLSGSGISGAIHGLFQDSAGDLIGCGSVVSPGSPSYPTVMRFSSTSGQLVNMKRIFLDLNGDDVADGIEGKDIVELPQSATSSVYALAVRTLNATSIIGLDANFEVRDRYTFNLDGKPNPEIPVAMVIRNRVLYVAGNYLESNTGFLVALRAIEITGSIELFSNLWSVQIADGLSDISLSDIERSPREEVILSGTLAPRLGSSLRTRAILIQIDLQGQFVRATTHNGNSEDAFLTDIDYDPVISSFLATGSGRDFGSLFNTKSKIIRTDLSGNEPCAESHRLRIRDFTVNTINPLIRSIPASFRSQSSLPPTVDLRTTLPQDCSRGSTCPNLDPICQTDEINISTGFNQSTNSNIPFTQADDDWTLVSSPNFQASALPQPGLVIPVNNSWHGTYPVNSQWISIYPNNSNVVGSNEPHVFERCFCICKDDEVSIELETSVDDELIVNLVRDDNTLVDVLQVVNSYGAVHSMWDTTYSNTLSVGKYCLQAEVTNFGGPMGFLANGTISSPSLVADGCCAPIDTFLIAGVKFDDLNCNGEFDRDKGDAEPGVANCVVTITNQNGITVWTGQTDANGYFSANVSAGTYDVSIAPVAPAIIHVPETGAYTVTVGAGEDPVYVEFGQKDPTDCNCLDINVNPKSFPVPPANTCCYDIVLRNNFGEYFDQVVVGASGGVISSAIAYGPYQQVTGTSSITITSSTQALIGEGFVIANICIEGSSSSELVTIDWMKDDEVICQYIEPINCGCGISVSAIQESGTTEECCTATVSIQNDFTQDVVTKVGFEIIDPSSSTTFFDEFNYNVAAGYDITSITNTSFVLESLNGEPIPSGDLQNIVSFCFGDTLQPSYQQFVEVTFLNQECLPLLDCTDTLQFDCTIIPDNACFAATVSQGVCDSVDQQQQTLTFTIQNDSGEPIDKVVIYSTGNISFVEQFNLATPIAVGGTFSESVTISTAGVSLPFSFSWNLAIHNTSTNPAYCCQIEVPVTIESCCEPCEDDWLIASTSQADSCCTDISIINTCDDKLQKISARVLTSGAYFNNLAINAGFTSEWTIGANSGADYLEAQYTASDYAAEGTYSDLFSFCLRDTVGNPVELVEINYLTYSAFGAGRDSVLCTDTIEVQCAREPGCLVLLRDSVYCNDDGEYFVDLAFRNTSYEPFTANELWLQVNPGLSTGGLGILGGINPNSQTVISTGVNLGPNQIFTQTVQITGSGIPGDILTLDAVLHSVNSSGIDYVCCWEDEVVQLTLPECEPACCRDYNAFLIDVINYQGPNSSCDTAFAQAPRLDSCQFTTIDWGDGTTTTTQGPFAVQHMYSQSGTYTVCTRFSESLDGGFTSCWRQVRCDTVVIDTCSTGSPVPLCDTLSEAMTQYFGWAAVTCSAYDDFDDQTAYNGNDYVLGLIDIRNHEGAPVGSNWSPPMYHGPANQKWTGNELGDIFGLAIDPYGNIYTSFYGLYSREPLTASQQHFGSPSLNPDQKPTIYWVNPVTGVIENVGEPLANYQSVGPEGIYLGFGNLAYNPVNQHLWVTNISNGKIYALDRNPNSLTFGDAIYSFAPPLSTTFGTDPGSVFGLGYNHVEHRLYYSVWRDNSPGLGAGVNEVFSVQLNSAGGIAGPAVSEWQATSLAPNYPFSNPVLDISFSSDGSQMLLSERSIISEPGNKLASYSHESRHLRLTTANPDAASTNWILDTSDPYASEHTLGANSAGGGDFTYDSPKFDSCDAIVVLSEDIIKPDPNSNLLAYGIRGVDVEGGTIADNWFVDLDGITDQSDKYEIGDVEVFRELCCTSKPVQRCALNQSEWDDLVNSTEVEEWPNSMYRISNLLDRRNIIPAQYWLTVDWGDGSVDRDIAGRDFPVDHIYASSGSFRIRLLHELIGTDGVQCFQTIEDFSVTDVEEADLSTVIQVMPNPFTSELRVSAKGLGANIEEVSLYNMTGQQVQAYKLGGQQDQHTLDTQALAAGMYVVRVRLSNGRVATLQVVHLE